MQRLPSLSSHQLLAKYLRNHVRKYIVNRTASSQEGVNQKWYESLSFASPEADYTAARSITTLSSDNTPEKECSQTLSFASPESDNTGQESHSIFSMLKLRSFLLDSSAGNQWSQTMSFASPETDLCSSVTTSAEDVETSRAKEALIDHFENKEQFRGEMVYSLSHASAEHDFKNPIFMSMLNNTMQDQLENTHSIQEETRLSKHVNPRELCPLPIMNEFKYNHVAMEELAAPGFSDEDPLPRNLAEASLPGDPRAIVITEAHMSYRIVSVNDSWENLCGYSQDECKGDTLACIQGPETNTDAVTSLMSNLMKGEEDGTFLTNYAKDGRKFHNRLRVGPLRNDSGKITHFVGVLKEVNEMGEHFDGEMMHA